MKNALISPIEPVAKGYRIAEVTDTEFEVAIPFFWVACDDTVTTREFIYDPITKAIIANPLIVPDVVIPVPTEAEILTTVQTAQLAKIANEYSDIINTASVIFTNNEGVEKTYQADPASQAYAQSTLVALSQQATPATPDGFYWVSSDNTHVPFTFSDIQGLASAMFAQGVTAFQNYQAKKAAIRAATSVADVQAITY